MAQINLFSFKIPELIKWLGWVLLIVFFWLNGCSNNKETDNKDVVKTPEITNTLPTNTKVEHQIVEPNKMVAGKGQNLSNVVIVNNDKKLQQENAELQKRLQFYKEEIELLQDDFAYQDSVKQADSYRVATELKSFKSLFEDDNLKLSINGIIGANQVKEITPTYTIKSKTLDVPKKVTTFRLLTGGGIENSLQFDKAAFHAGLGFQNKKGNVLIGSFNTQNVVSFSYYHSLFQIKK